MSLQNVREVLRGAQDGGSAYGSRISSGELTAALDHARGLQPTARLLDTFESLDASRLTPAAQQQRDRHLVELAGKVAGPLMSRDGSTRLDLDLRINRRGWPTGDSKARGRPQPRELEASFYRLALALSEGTVVGGRVCGMTLADRERLVSRAVTVIHESLRAGGGGRMDGLTKNQTQQLRSSAATVLFHLGVELVGRGRVGRLKNQCHSTLVQLARDEPDRLLGEHFARLLDRREYRRGLSRSQREAAGVVFDQRFAARFDVANIIDADGYIRWEHAAGEGENIFRSFLVALAEEEIGGASFVKTRGGHAQGSADFELTFHAPRNGIKGVRMHVREYADDMFAALGRNVGFSYGGHSDVGQNQEASLEDAMLEGLKSSCPQIALLDLCSGVDNLDDNHRELAELTVLTTLDASHYDLGRMRDEHGSFTGVTDSEGLVTLMVLLDGLSRRHTYATISRNINDAIFHWARMRNPNVITASRRDYREVRWMHLDGDGDGVMDAHDTFFQVGLTTPAADRRREFELRHEADPDRLAGSTIKNAVVDLNVGTHYNGATVNNSMVQHRFSAGGYFDGSGTGELIRIEKGRNHDGSAVHLVKVNSGLGHTSREALSALTHYLSFMWLVDNDELGWLSETDAKVMALMFAAYRLKYDDNGERDNRRVWSQLCRAVGLPRGLPYGAMMSLLKSEEHDYAGNQRLARRYRRGLSTALRAALADPSTGRGAGIDPPVQV